MTEEKFIGYFRLVEACRRPGCPICRCVSDESRGYLDALLYEQVTDLDTRRAIRSAWGFCGWHTWMLPEIAGSLFGAAIIYEDLLTQALRRTEGLGERRPRRWRDALRSGRRRAARSARERSPCPACVTAADAERRYLTTLVAFGDDGDLQAAYAGSDGVCLRHLTAAATGEGGSHARTLVERTRAKWKRVGEDLASFVSKHDYRNRQPYTEAEGEACARAFALMAGARGVFGNDVRRMTGDDE